MHVTLRRLALFATLLAPIALHAEDRWLATWAASPLQLLNPDAKFSTDTTLRQIVHLSQGGDTVRIAFSNEFGAEPLNIGGAQLAFHRTESSIVEGTGVQLTFSGQPTTTIAPGQFITSDPVKLKVPIFSDLVITLFLPAQQHSNVTVHAAAHQVNYLAPGNQLTQETLTEAKPVESWYWLKDVQVTAPSGKYRAVVAFGDSITDGTGSTTNGNNRWPDQFAVLLANNKKTKNLSVVNQGIGGNRILHEIPNDVSGPKAIDRFDRDVLGMPGVKYIIILEGINDIGRSYVPRTPGGSVDPVTPAQLQAAIKDFVTRAHQHGIKVFGATVLPYQGAPYFTDAGEQDRQAMNTWIRTSKVYDGFVDFDKAVQDPSAPTKILAVNDRGDHLHPSPAGYTKMANIIRLKLFK